MKTRTWRCARTPVPHHPRGFTAAELLVVIAVIGVLFTMSIPFFLSAYQAAAARADVQQVMSLLNQARERAIKQNNSVCVSIPNNQQMQFLQGSCAGGAWVGAGTDATGAINLPAGFTIGPVSSTVTFTYLGAATAATTYTMTNSTTGGTTTISIALSGRVRSP